MSSYLEKLHANQIYFPKGYARFLHNLFYMADSHKVEEVIQLNIYGGFEKYRDCVKEEGLDGIKLTINLERDEAGYKVVAYHAVIDTKVLLAQLFMLLSNAQQIANVRFFRCGQSRFRNGRRLYLSSKDRRFSKRDCSRTVSLSDRRL